MPALARQDQVGVPATVLGVDSQIYIIDISHIYICRSVNDSGHLEVDVSPGSDELEGDVGAALLARDGEGGQPVLVHSVHVGTWCVCVEN